MRRDHVLHLNAPKRERFHILLPGRKFHGIVRFDVSDGKPDASEAFSG
jgi:hypothetical protein